MIKINGKWKHTQEEINKMHTPGIEEKIRIANKGKNANFLEKYRYMVR